MEMDAGQNWTWIMKKVVKSKLLTDNINSVWLRKHFY